MGIYKKERFGFTLLELVIVTVILGVLAAVAIPQFNKVYKRARTGACISNMKKLYDQIDLWMMENNTNYPNDGGDRLVTDGYVREIPICPSGSGRYLIEAYVSNMSISVTCPNVDDNPDHVMQGEGD